MCITLSSAAVQQQQDRFGIMSLDSVGGREGGGGGGGGAAGGGSNTNTVNSGGSRMKHSLSTPCVDGTPSHSRGGKKLAIRVQMLDDTITLFQVQVSSGWVCFVVESRKFGIGSSFIMIGICAEFI